MSGVARGLPALRPASAFPGAGVAAFVASADHGTASCEASVRKLKRIWSAATTRTMAGGSALMLPSACCSIAAHTRCHTKSLIP